VEFVGVKRSAGDRVRYFRSVRLKAATLATKAMRGWTVAELRGSIAQSQDAGSSWRVMANAVTTAIGESVTVWGLDGRVRKWEVELRGAEAFGVVESLLRATGNLIRRGEAVAKAKEDVEETARIQGVVNKQMTESKKTLEAEIFSIAHHMHDHHKQELERARSAAKMRITPMRFSDDEDEEEEGEGGERGDDEVVSGDEMSHPFDDGSLVVDDLSQLSNRNHLDIARMARQKRAEKRAAQDSSKRKAETAEPEGELAPCVRPCCR